MKKYTMGCFALMWFLAGCAFHVTSDPPGLPVINSWGLQVGETPVNLVFMVNFGTANKMMRVVWPDGVMSSERDAFTSPHFTRDGKIEQLIKINSEKVAKAAVLRKPEKQQVSFPESPVKGDTWVEPISGIEMVYVEGGCFEMGHTEAEKKELIDRDGLKSYDHNDRREACVDSFWIGKYEVTVEQWLKIVGYLPYLAIKELPHSQKEYDILENPDNPIVLVSWSETYGFLSHLNYISSSQRFRLPTEAEWEFACKSGGKDEKFCGGDVAEEVAWVEGNSDGHTHPVGEKRPNSLGLYDMSGNANEWVWDWLDEADQVTSPKQNPAGPFYGQKKIMKGAAYSFEHYPTQRTSRSPGFYIMDTGFRLMMEQKEEDQK
ncbi:MAG: formylglycine-generating enzyme family protein [Proteobacteria bacterium]|nr:formylglycine-generating enzyme family protein [Pseudomonadota bacterium]MBU1715536.1 formylglycine-generating enzyme family protein [Pseudomonadota bacterium]